MLNGKPLLQLLMNLKPRQKKTILNRRISMQLFNSFGGLSFHLKLLSSFQFSCLTIWVCRLSYSPDSKPSSSLSWVGKCLFKASSLSWTSLSASSAGCSLLTSPTSYRIVTYTPSTWSHPPYMKTMTMKSPTHLWNQ